eukprot:scaffold2549_cov57-Phaeocystis_antarctica.AAC.6
MKLEASLRFPLNDLLFTPLLLSHWFSAWASSKKRTASASWVRLRSRAPCSKSTSSISVVGSLMKVIARGAPSKPAIAPATPESTVVSREEIIEPERSKAVEIGGFGGGSLEHPGQWRGTQWAGPFLGVPSCPEPPGAP